MVVREIRIKHMCLLRKPQQILFGCSIVRNFDRLGGRSRNSRVLTKFKLV